MMKTEKGYGKRSKLEEYRRTNRGGKGVKTLQVTPKTGYLATIKSVNEEEDLMITNRSGITIRISASDMRVMGRATQGVKVIRIDEGDSIADIAVIPKSEEPETPTEDGENPTTGDGENPTAEDGTTESNEDDSDTTANEAEGDDTEA